MWVVADYTHTFVATPDQWEEPLVGSIGLRMLMEEAGVVRTALPTWSGAEAAVSRRGTRFVGAVGSVGLFLEGAVLTWDETDVGCGNRRRCGAGRRAVQGGVASSS